MTDSHQQTSTATYSRTPRQERVLNPSELAHRLEAFNLLTTPPKSPAAPKTNTIDRRRSNAAYVPRNAARAFQSTTTSRVETSKEVKRRTLPAQGINWAASDTPHDNEDGFSCTQLAYAQTQLQAYSDELRAKHSPRVPEEDTLSVDDDTTKDDPDAYKKIPRRPEDRPNWTQQNGDEDEDSHTTNRLKAGAARMLNFSKREEPEHRGVAPMASYGGLGLKAVAHIDAEPVTRPSSLERIPSRRPSLLDFNDQDEDELMKYVKSLPRKQPEPSTQAPVQRGRTPTVGESSRYAGDAMKAAVDAAKRARASSTGVANKDPVATRRRSGLFDHRSPFTVLTRKSSNQSDLHTQSSRPNLPRTNTDEIQQMRAREREEKASRRRTWQPNASSVTKRTSWMTFSGNNHSYEPLMTSQDESLQPEAQQSPTNTTSQLNPSTYRGQSGSSTNINRLSSSMSAGQLGGTPAIGSLNPYLSYLDASDPTGQLRASKSVSHSMSPQVTGSSYSSVPTNRSSTAPPKTMLVAQAAKKLHDEELERKRRELQEMKQAEPEQRRTRTWQGGRPSSMLFRKASAATVSSVKQPAALPTAALVRQASAATVSSVKQPAALPMAALAVQPVAPAPVETESSPPPPSGETWGAISAIPTRRPARDVPPAPKADVPLAKKVDVPAKKEKKPGGLKRWFKKVFGGDK